MLGRSANGLRNDTNYVSGLNHDRRLRENDTNYVAPHASSFPGRQQEDTNFVEPRAMDNSSSATLDWQGSINPFEIKIHETVFANPNCTIEKGRHKDLAVIVKRSINHSLIEREIDFLRRSITSEYVVRFVGWYKTDLCTALVMQKCAMNLKEWLKHASTDVDLQLKMMDISEGIAKGLAHINRLDIIHNDLKPLNVFVDKFNKPYIGDFGVATRRGERRLGYTKQYFDKETLDLDVVPDEKSDSWLLGATLWEFWAREPFNVDEDVVLDHVQNDTIKGILQKLLRKRRWRSTANQILVLFGTTTERSDYMSDRTASMDAGFALGPVALRPLHETTLGGDITLPQSPPIPPVRRVTMQYTDFGSPEARKPTLAVESPPRPLQRLHMGSSNPYNGPTTERTAYAETERYWESLKSEDANLETLRSILASGAVHVESPKYGLTGLQFACLRGRHDQVAMLLEFGANPNERDNNGKLPIQMSPNIKVWRALAPVMPKPEGDLWDASGRRDDVAVRLLLAVEEDPILALRQLKNVELGGEKKIVAPLHVAAFRGCLLVCQLLLECGANVKMRDNRGWTPLFFAAQAGNLDVARLLLTKASTPSDISDTAEDGQTCLHVALQFSQDEVARLLIDRGAVLEPSFGSIGKTVSVTPLHIAVEYGNVTLARLLCERGANTNSVSTNGYTPLALAAQRGNIELVRLLLEMGADREQSLDVAADYGHWDAVQLLIEDVDGTSSSIDANNTPDNHIIHDDYRGHAILEVLTTERKYVDDLKRLRGLLEEIKIMKQFSMSKIFAVIEELYILHTRFLARLEEMQSPKRWDSSGSMLATIFLQFVSLCFLLLSILPRPVVVHNKAPQKEDMCQTYIQYVKIYWDAKKQLDDEENTNPDFKKFLAELQKTEGFGHSLKDLLVRPMQRYIKYPLLIREIYKRTPPEHPDAANLKSALEAMSDLASTVNNKMAEMVKVMALFEAFDATLNCPPTLLTSMRRCLISIDAQDRAGKQVHLFLCSDLLMVVSLQQKVFRRGDQKYRFVRWLDLLEMTVDDNVAPDVFRITLVEEPRNGSLTTPGSARIHEFRIESSYPSSRRDDFMTAFMDALQGVKQRG
ncbi:Protein T2 [Phlyctochytrium bullatum]|nr:Protein T2 [Phlyctochytrium bullatum]